MPCRGGLYATLLTYAIGRAHASAMVSNQLDVKRAAIIGAMFGAFLLIVRAMQNFSGPVEYWVLGVAIQALVWALVFAGVAKLINFLRR